MEQIQERKELLAEEMKRDEAALEFRSVSVSDSDDEVKTPENSSIENEITTFIIEDEEEAPIITDEKDKPLQSTETKQPSLRHSGQFFRTSGEFSYNPPAKNNTNQVEEKQSIPSPTNYERK